MRLIQPRDLEELQALHLYLQNDLHTLNTIITTLPVFFLIFPAKLNSIPDIYKKIKTEEKEKLVNILSIAIDKVAESIKKNTKSIPDPAFILNHVLSEPLSIDIPINSYTFYLFEKDPTGIALKKRDATNPFAPKRSANSSASSESFEPDDFNPYKSESQTTDTPTTSHTLDLFEKPLKRAESKQANANNPFYSSDSSSFESDGLDQFQP